ncbi:MAG: hypothetical protein A4E40_00094 [Methanoregulaceae archaeon PtaU1.Bin059]|nr:MAG: hypothetical protein A4E40_00094 [Methanoregulaceae archaeon PtaU1.Bin059]
MGQSTGECLCQERMTLEGVELLPCLCLPGEEIKERLLLPAAGAVSLFQCDACEAGVPVHDYAVAERVDRLVRNERSETLPGQSPHFRVG